MWDVEVVYYNAEAISGQEANGANTPWVHHYLICQPNRATILPEREED